MSGGGDGSEVKMRQIVNVNTQDLGGSDVFTLVDKELVSALRLSESFCDDINYLSLLCSHMKSFTQNYNLMLSS